MSIAAHGLLLWYKQPNLTSFSALHPIKKRLGKGVKVGHAGTLDKAAEGLQLVLIGAFTKLNPIFSHLDKEYIATISFGKETTTLDEEGQLCKEAALPSVAAFEQALGQLRLGRIAQEPPIYSALHINGKRAYQYAQAGEQLVMKPRLVDLHHVKLISMETDSNNQVRQAKLSVACGGGFYVRSFARDLAYACGSVATLSHLIRVGIGHYHQQPWLFSHQAATSDPSALEQHLLLAKAALGRLNNVHLIPIAANFEQAIARGSLEVLNVALKALTPVDDQPVLLINTQGKLLAQAYRKANATWAYQFVVSYHD